MLYDGLDMGSYASLQFIPTKASSDYYTLEDVLTNGQGLEGEHVNLLAAIRKVGVYCIIFRGPVTGLYGEKYRRKL